ncbi:MAG: murein L,D-transpeptidase catalytic domain family protein, partial [Flavobacterium sp.]|nr:murein L,D-transpeptidase catalytic domain family protein [Flavobacterium sp.]
ALKSGIIFAGKFSNEVGSNLSCKGTFKTANVYESNYGKGQYKIGLRLIGLDKDINDHTLERNIVFHSSYGFWSSGCFMTPPKINKKIIDLTKNGSMLIVL